MGEETIRRAASAFKLPPEPLSDERESLALSLLAPIHAAVFLLACGDRVRAGPGGCHFRQAVSPPLGSKKEIRGGGAVSR